MRSHQKLSTILCLVALLISCKKNSTTPELPPPTGKVTVTIEGRSHTDEAGAVYTKEYTGEIGTSFDIETSHFMIPNTDSGRLIIRNPLDENNKSLGTRIVATTNGKITLPFPTQNTSYDAYLINTLYTPGSEYQKIDDWVNTGSGAGFLRYNPTMKWAFENRDSYTGSQQIIIDVVQEINEAMKLPWIIYGTLSFTSNHSESQLKIGYSNGSEALGWHGTDGWAGVNPVQCDKYRIPYARIFHAEIFELVTRTAKLDLIQNTYPVITNNDGTLNRIGIDLLCYVFVKDLEIPANTSGFRFKMF